MAYYAYFLENIGVPEKQQRTNQKLFLLINQLKIHPDSEVFCDDYFTIDKPDLKLLLNTVKKGDCIIVKALDDLGDNIQDILNVLLQIQAKNAGIVIHKDDRYTINELIDILLYCIELEKCLKKNRRLKGYVKAVADKKVGRKRKDKSSDLYTYKEVQTVAELMLTVLQQTGKTKTKEKD